MTRLDALERVAEAPRDVIEKRHDPKTAWQDVSEALSRMSVAVRALDALPASPAPAERTVTLELWAHKDGDVVQLLPGSFIAREWGTNAFRRRLGTVTLPIAEGGE